MNDLNIMFWQAFGEIMRKNFFTVPCSVLVLFCRAHYDVSLILRSGGGRLSGIDAGCSERVTIGRRHRTIADGSVKVTVLLQITEQCLFQHLMLTR